MQLLELLASLLFCFVFNLKIQPFFSFFLSICNHNFQLKLKLVGFFRDYIYAYIVFSNLCKSSWTRPGGHAYEISGSILTDASNLFLKQLWSYFSGRALCLFVYMNILLMSVLFFCIKSASKVNCYKDVICCYCFLLTMQWACQSLTLRLLGI